MSEVSEVGVSASAPMRRVALAASGAADVARVLRRHRVALLVGAMTLLGLVVAVRGRTPVLVDDVGITARYAGRIADGKGWTYNDGDRTNGASAPLYTLLLAAAHRVGLDVVSVARLIGLACFAITAGLVTFLGSRFVGVVGGAVAGVLVVSSSGYQSEALGGMESALAVVLGLAVVVALAEDRDGWAGVLLGLALLNKLDAGLLALAVAVGYLAVQRRPPWRIAAISGAMLAPWLVFSTIYFGSPLPYSFTQKASGDAVDHAPHDATWVLDGLVGSQGAQVLLAVSAVAVVPALARWSRARAVALAAVLGWGVLHGLAFSLIDLGDRFTWYLTVLYPVVALGAGTTLGFLFTGLARRRAFAVVLTVALTLQCLSVLSWPYGEAAHTVRAVRGERWMTDYEGFEQQRVRASQYLGEVAEPGDVILTCFGWPAYYAPQATIDETCPLNTREPVDRPRWAMEITFPGTEPPPTPFAGVQVASFVSEVGEGGRVDVFRIGLPD